MYTNTFAMTPTHSPENSFCMIDIYQDLWNYIKKSKILMQTKIKAYNLNHDYQIVPFVISRWTMGGVTCTTGTVLCLYHYRTATKHWYFICILHLHMHTAAHDHTQTHTHMHTHTTYPISYYTTKAKCRLWFLCCLMSVFLPEILNNVINLTDKGCSLKS